MTFPFLLNPAANSVCATGGILFPEWRRTRRESKGINMELIIGLLSGAVGGNVAGKLLGKIDQGTLINSISGIVGGGLGGTVLSMLGAGGMAEGGMDLMGIIGQVASDQKDREAFQEVDYRAMYGPLAKWVAEIDRLDRIPEYISHAFHVAQNGRPGPVVLALPEDMLSGSGHATQVPAATLASGKAAQSDIAQITDRLRHAKSPLILIGGGGWSADAADAIAAFAATAQVPVAASFRCQDFMSNDHPNYVGDVGIGINPKLADRVRNADVLCVLGPRLGEMTTSGYSLVEVPQPQQSLIHVYPDPNELGRVYRPDLAVCARPAAVAVQLRDAAQDARADRSDLVAVARADYEAWQVPEETPGRLKMERVVSHLKDVLPPDAILTNGAGNYSAWLHRYFRYRAWKSQLAPTSGSMGYGLPAAIAAKLEKPDTDVICLAGDGCFQMVMQEFGTAAQYGAHVIVLIADNGMYGTIRMHQQKHYPKRPSGTQLVNPDFAAIARAYGGYGALVETNAEFETALAEARAANVPAIIHMKTAPEALSPKLVLED